MDVAVWEGFKWFWGLTCEFWAENAKNKCKGNKQKQIPFGDDNKKSKRKGNCDCKGNHKGKKATVGGRSR
jgi:hypothetical protein